jgi:hypothetical protein
MATAAEALGQVLSGAVPPEAIKVAGRTKSCPCCGTSAWFGRRAFQGEEASYVLCKWCGYRVNLDVSPDEWTLAIPVYHVCPGPQRVLTWVEFMGEAYNALRWTCICGSAVRVCDSLRPYPRFSSDPSLIELPGR